MWQRAMNYMGMPNKKYWRLNCWTA